MSTAEGQTPMSNELSPALAARAGQLSKEALVLLADTFREGRQQGRASVRGELDAFVCALLEGLQLSYEALTPAEIAHIEDAFTVPDSSPVVAARFGGASDALEQVKDELGRLARAANAE